MTKLWFDVGTILNCDRPANGVVRCEAEYASYLLTSRPVTFIFCTFVGGVLEVVPRKRVVLALEKILDQFISSLSFDDANPWGFSTTSWDHVSTGGEGIDEPQITAQDVYFSIGADWLKGPLNHLYDKKKALGFKVVLYCHDTIPVFHPNLTLSWLADLFPEYLSSVAWCADLIICNSQTTQSDLIFFLETIGSPVPKNYVVSLGCEIRKSANYEIPKIFSVTPKQPYILFVSTIEIRKNHQVLYLAYKDLLSQGIRDLPLLVLVGSPGWGVEELLQKIEDDAELQNYFLFLSQVTDVELSCLYRDALFTVYPSHYEGWGLPVAESLAFRKFCLASTAPSLQEIGGDLVDYLDPLDQRLWAEKILHYYCHPELVRAREKQIQSQFSPMPWVSTCREMTILAWTLSLT
jgi:glycosyltransferase involved in cell wall biosynthesis